MHSSLPSPTQHERARWSWFREIGCIACRIEDELRDEIARTGCAAEVHHLLSGGYRIGHSHTIPLCSWHHRAVPASGGSFEPESLSSMADLFGPSLALDSRWFRNRYGADHELLKRTEAELGRVKANLI